MGTEQLRDEDELREFFSRDPIPYAYQLGDLDERYAPFCTWYGRREGDELSHVLLVYKGLSVPAVLLSGEGPGAEELLRDVKPLLPRSCFVQVRPEHEVLVYRMLGNGQLRTMIRMGLERRAYCSDLPRDLVEPISHADTAALMGLFRYYPDNFFEPYQLETGLYSGIWEDGKLVSAAGVHVISERFDVVAVGNIVTHPDYRNRGLAMACTSALLDQAFEKVSLAALNTGKSNEAAYRAFRRVGFREHCSFVEGLVELD